MAEEFFNNINNKSYTYDELKSVYNKADKNSDEYKFLNSIFGFDNKEEHRGFSKTIFGMLSAFDNEGNNETFDIKDLKAFADIKSTYGYHQKTDVFSFSSNDMQELVSTAEGMVGIKENKAEVKDYFYILNKDDEFKSETQAKQDITKEVDKVINEVKAFAKANLHDKQAQLYLRSIEELVAKDKIKILNTDLVDKNLGDSSAAIDSKRNMYVHYNIEENHISHADVMQNMLHELGHYQDGDFITSQKEEEMVERKSHEYTNKILGLESAPDFEAKIKSWLDSYITLPLTSPGYDNIPFNMGIPIREEVLEVKQDSSSYEIIVNSKAYDGERYIVTYGDERDDYGNPYPVSTSKLIVIGDCTYQVDMNSYDKVKNKWTGQDKVIITDN